MIILIIGGIGSGKTLTAVRRIVDQKQFAFTNFQLKHVKDYKRLKVEDVVSFQELKTGGLSPVNVNWNFWENQRKKYDDFSIYLDEAHNIISSRASMTKMNRFMSKWVSQIRKITSDSDRNHLYIISQTFRKVDVDFRDLAQIFIRCKLIQSKKTGKVYIVNSFFTSLERAEFNYKPYTRIMFLANPYFKYYDTNAMVRFDTAEEYV